MGGGIHFAFYSVLTSMKFLVATLLVIIAPCFLAIAPADLVRTEPVRKTMRVYVDNVKRAKGTIWIGVYASEEEFLDREKARLVHLKVTGTGRIYLEVPDMVVGNVYALGLFHDENDNGEFDLNWLGLPAEPWAFSGAPKTRLRLPFFSEVSFQFTQQEVEQVVRLRKW